MEEDSTQTTSSAWNSYKRNCRLYTHERLINRRIHLEPSNRGRIPLRKVERNIYTVKNDDDNNNNEIWKTDWGEAKQRLPLSVVQLVIVYAHIDGTARGSPKSSYIDEEPPSEKERERERGDVRETHSETPEKRRPYTQTTSSPPHHQVRTKCTSQIFIQ